jgi:outer membrane scaffolding protein for murein synthesis (MipA/OmpV family)
VARWIPVLLFIVLGSSKALAQFEPGASTEDSGVIGAVTFNMPRYMGADGNRTRALPFLNYQWANGWFAGMVGIGHAWSNEPGQAYGLRLTVAPERKENDDNALKGLGDVDMQAEFGGFYAQKLGAGFGLQSALRYGAGNDHDGALAELGLSWGTRVAGGIFFRMGLMANWANQAYMQSYFGVTPEQSARSGYSEHDTSGGLRDTRASLMLMQMFDRTTMGLVMVSQARWQGDAARSPFVRDTTNTMAIAALLYRF